ncbi:MAG: PKD domain-containing protein [Flavobacteriales bacterium]|nr:PKD domain-containing protein [Flavobacteriales bacterium]
MIKARNFLIALLMIAGSLGAAAQECNIIYVTPNGSGSGTKAAPTNIQNAMSMVGPGLNQIRMAQGTYPLSDTLFLVNGVTIDGSYDPSTWVKSNNIPTIFHRDATAPSSVSIFALAAIDISDFHLHDLSVIVDDAVEPSSSTCGIYLNGCSQYTLDRIRVTAGNGGDGIEGVPGGDGLVGQDGQPGQNGANCSNQPNAGGAGGNGWSGGIAAGGDGGNGGPEGEGFSLFSNANGKDGFPGQAGTGLYAGAGGMPGLRFRYLINDPCSTFGDCNSGGTANGTAGINASQDGADGADGLDGVSSHAGGFFVPGHGTYGQNGEPGSGGGGGGGSGSAGVGVLPFANPGTGAGGGGGGEGGEGGHGATSGGGGGGSFGIYITNNGVGGSLNDCVLESGLPGVAGMGGYPGGLGGLGGQGGPGGEQQDGNAGPCSRGGAGGVGSRGGRGGNGGNGAPGESLPLYQEPIGIQVTQSSLAANVEPDVLMESTACTYSDINFTTNANGIIEWFYEGTTVPQNTVGQSTSVQYTTMGAQDLTMVSNGVPYFHSGFVNIFIDGTPYLPTIQAQDTICPGDVVNFSSTWPTSFNVLGFRWDFGDPNSGNQNTSSQGAPSHTYNDVGTYMVTLQTQSPCCGWAKPDTHYVVVMPVVEPDVFITATSTEICEGESITFGAVPYAGGSSPTFEWFVNGASSGTGTSFTPNFISDGDQVKVTMTSSYPCPTVPTVTSDVITVIVHLNPVIDCSNVTNSYLGAETGFNADVTAATPPFEYFWQFGDGGSATDQSPSHLYGSTGTYSASVEVTDTFGCSAICNVPVDIILPPYVYGGFTYTEDSQCGSTEVAFTDTSQGNPVTWYWDFGDGDTSSLQNPTHTFTGTGPYTVTLAASNTVFTDTVVVPNMITPWVIPVAGFNVSPTEVCDSSDLRFYDNSVNAASWQWDFGDGNSGTFNTSDLQNPFHAFNDSGTYIVNLTVFSEDGCQAQATPVTILVHASPIAGFGMDTIVCTDLPITIHDSSHFDVNIDAWEYHFSDKDVTIPQQGDINDEFDYTFDEPGWYVVTQTVSNRFGCVDSAKVFVEVRAHPIADFYPDSVALQLPDTTMQFWNTSLNIVPEYSFWDFGNGYTVDSILDAVGIFQDSGLFDVQLIVMREIGCPDTITIPFRVWEQETFFIQTAFTPNDDGINDVFEIKEKGIVDWHIQIFDRWGKLVWETNDVTEYWDGTHRESGKPVQEGAYSYQIHLTWYTGKEFAKMGTITIFR